MVAGDNHAKVEHVGRRRRLRRGGLFREAGSATAGGDGDGDEGEDKGVCFVDVEDLEATKGDNQGQHANDDDAGVGRDGALGDCGQALAADNVDNDGEASHGGEIEQHRDRDEIATTWVIC